MVIHVFDDIRRVSECGHSCVSDDDQRVLECGHSCASDDDQRVLECGHSCVFDDDQTITVNMSKLNIHTRIPIILDFLGSQSRR